MDQFDYAQMRTSARIAMLSRDCSEKVWRAMLRRAPEILDQLCPGTRVYFQSPHPPKGRFREDEHRWRGPATVVAKESEGRYYLGWRGRVLLAAKQQLRLATPVEQAASETIAEEVGLVAEGAKDNKIFQDSTVITEAPKQRWKFNDRENPQEV